MMKKLLLVMLVVICTNISAQNIQKDEKVQYVVLCDKSEKNMSMYIIDEKFCFLSAKDKNLIALFNPTQIFKITVISPVQKNNFKEYVEKYCCEYKAQIDAVFYIKLKDGAVLPHSLAKYYQAK